MLCGISPIVSISGWPPTGSRAVLQLATQAKNPPKT